MEIKERRWGDVMVLDLHGPLAGRQAVRMIDSAVRRLRRARTRVVVANLAGVPSIDLAGLGALVGAYRTMRGAHGALRLACVPPSVHELVEVARLISVLNVFDTVEDAVRGGGPPLTQAANRLPTISLESIQRFLLRALR